MPGPVFFELARSLALMVLFATVSANPLAAQPPPNRSMAAPPGTFWRAEQRLETEVKADR